MWATTIMISHLVTVCTATTDKHLGGERLQPYAHDSMSEQCPKCNDGMMRPDGGCPVCMNCGYNRCGT